MSIGQIASHSVAVASASARSPPTAGNMSQGTSMEATASASHDKIRWGDAALPSLSDRASRMRKCSMSAVVAAAEAAATHPARPSPNGSFDGELGQCAAGQRQSAEAQGQRRGYDQRRRPAAAR